MAAPDYHFLYLDPALGVEWFFVAARQYWEHFRPMVVNNLELISYVYGSKKRTVAVTALVRRDMAEKIATDVASRFPNIQYDPLVYDTIDDMKLTLDGRSDFQQRFGIPEGSAS